MFANLLSFLVCFSFSITTLASERQHKLMLLGAAKSPGRVLTVEHLKKDFPKLTSLKVAFRDEQVFTYEGVLVSDFIAKYAEPGVTKVKMKATNNYIQTLDATDIVEWKALLTWSADGKIIPTTSRGTFRVMYDYPAYKDKPEVVSKMENNSVWQVVEITFEK